MQLELLISLTGQMSIVHLYILYIHTDCSLLGNILELGKGAISIKQYYYTNVQTKMNKMVNLVEIVDK